MPGTVMHKCDSDSGQHYHCDVHVTVFMEIAVFGKQIVEG